MASSAVFDLKAWEAFLRTTGIPRDEIKPYAGKLMEHRIRNPLDLDKDTMKEVGITVIGDIKAILNTRETQGEQEKTTKPKTNYTPKIEPPRIKSEMTNSEFRKFKTDWEVYKTITELQPNQTAPQLYTACDPDVQTSIINTSKEFLQLDEATNMKTLEDIVTKQSNPAVHRLAFSNISQSENETISAYVVRLKSAAKD